MTLADGEVLQLQRKAERQRIVDYVSDFHVDAAMVDELSRWSARGASRTDVQRALANPAPDLTDVAALLSPAARADLETIAGVSHALTVKRFGHTMHLFAPLYLSNECVSECTYCGFQVWNRDIVRRTLTPEQVASETRYLKHLGFRHVLLVAGEHPKHVSSSYVSQCIAAAAAEVPHVSIEVQAWDEATYAGFVDGGCDGLVLYQETYDPRVYPDVHLKGNKRFFEWRLGAPERAARAGMRRLGIGALLGLNADWRFEVLALVAHARHLMRHAWRADLTVALPRLEPAAGFDQPPRVLSDAEFTLALCVLRLALPDAGIVLSTREPAPVRDGLARICVTHMSAGSRTEPGGYTEPGGAEPQFEISDERAPAAIARVLNGFGYDPVWKDDSPVLRRGRPGAERLYDELNRATPKTQSGLLEAMQELQVTVDGRTHPLERPFMVIATQNPNVGYDGTYRLPPAQLDRFLARVSLGYPSNAQEIALLREPPAGGAQRAGSLRELLAAQAQVEAVRASEALLAYIVAVLAATRSHPLTETGASPRAGLQLLGAARARAALQGRDYVLPDDVIALAVPVLAHRIEPVAAAALDAPLEIVSDALEDVLAR